MQKVVYVAVAVLLIASTVGWVSFHRGVSAAPAVPLPVPASSKPLPPQFVSDFKVLLELNADINARRLDVFEGLSAKARKSPLDEYQLASDLAVGIDNRLANQLKQTFGANPGFEFNHDCVCLVPEAPKATPAAPPAHK